MRSLCHPCISVQICCTGSIQIKIPPVFPPVLVRAVLQSYYAGVSNPTFARQCHGNLFSALLLQGVDDTTGPLPFRICPSALLQQGHYMGQGLSLSLSQDPH